MEIKKKNFTSIESNLSKAVSWYFWCAAFMAVEFTIWNQVFGLLIYVISQAVSEMVRDFLKFSFTRNSGNKGLVSNSAATS